MTRSFSTQPVKHIPQRTCLACRKKRAKRELIRLVSSANGDVEIDTADKKPGRGAYLCPALACWEVGLRGDRLEHALRISLTRDNRERLMQMVHEFLLSGGGAV